MTSPTLGRGQLWHVHPPGKTLVVLLDQPSPFKTTPCHWTGPRKKYRSTARWTLEALKVSAGNSTSLSQRPIVISRTLPEFCSPGQEVRRLQGTPLPTKQQLKTRKDSRLTRRSSYITSITRSSTPRLQVMSTQGATDLPTALLLSCDI